MHIFSNIFLYVDAAK